MASSRVCVQCGASIDERAKQARRCHECADGQRRASKNVARDRRVKSRSRVCSDCEARLTSLAKRCDACRRKHVAEMHRAWVAANHERRRATLAKWRAANPEKIAAHNARRPSRAKAPDLRRCVDCGASIAHRYQNARSCEACHAVRDAASRAKYATEKLGRVIGAKAAWWARKKAARSPKGCVDCGVTLDVRRRKRCEPCAYRNRLMIALVSEEKRRAKLRHQEGGGVTMEQWSHILAAFEHRCAYCLRGDIELTMDHVEPVSSGGRHEPANVIPACKPCNSRKGNRRIWSMLPKRRAA